MPNEFITKNGLISQGNITGTGSLVVSQNITASNISVSATGSFGIVGIGTTSPTQKLSLATGGNLSFQNTLGATGNYGAIYSYNDLVNTTTPATAIRFIRDISNIGPDGAIAFDTNNTERIRVTSANGYVGIGTTTPNNKLHVYNSAGSSTTASNAISIFEQNSNAVIQVCVPDANAGGLFFSRSGSAYYSGIERSGTDLFLKNNSTTAVTINSSGNVGIGTTSPSASLDVLGNSLGAILRSNLTTSYAGLRLYNDQNSSLRSLEIDYAGSAYAGSLLSGGPTGESGAITTTGAYPLVFGTSNTARMTILSGGNVGVGSTNPSSKFEVLTSAVSLANQPNIIANFRGDTDGRSLIRVDNTSTSAGAAALQAGISFVAYSNVSSQPSANKHEAQIILGSTGATSVTGGQTGTLQIIAPQDIAFNVSASNTIMTGSSYTTFGYNAMYITRAGNIGIGTTNPSSRLHISGSSATAITITDDVLYTNSISNDNSVMTYTVDTGNSAAASAAHIFKRYNTELVRIDPSGNVGIGQSSPASKLHVLGSSFITASSNTSNVKFEGGGGNGLAFGTIDATSTYASWIQSGYVSNFGTATYNLLLQPLGGNVGIGTTNPNDKLTIFAGNYLSFQTFDTTFNSGRGARLGITSVGSGIGELIFETYKGGSGGGERMRITADGNVGIGTTSPAYLLDVSGSSRFGFISTNTHQFTGSVSISGSLNATASWANNVVSASYATTANALSSMNISQFTNNSKYHYHRTDISSLSSSATNLVQPLSTFDYNNATNGPGAAWYNYFSSTHGDYLTSLIANQHRTANWYVAYREGSAGTPTNPVWYALLHEGNYTTYTVTKTGTGASGTWSITSSIANALNTANNYTVGSLTSTTQLGGSSGTLVSYVTPGVYATGTSTGNAIGIISNTTFANNGAIANIGLNQSSSNANDITAKVHMTIGGWYQNSGTGIPIYLGNGYTIESSPTMVIAPADANGGGNVGIGTTNPIAKLHVVGNISGSSFTSSISNAVGFLGTSSWAQTANALNTGNSYTIAGLTNNGTLSQQNTLSMGSGYQILATTGTAPIPGIAFVGNTNTGIYSPSSNIIGFSISGSEKVRIDSSGNLLIGTTTSPSNAGLSVGSTGTVSQILGGMQNTSWRIREKSAIDWCAWTTNINDAGTQDDATKSSWLTQQGFGNGNDAWRLGRYPAGSSTLNTFIYVNSSGNVGIGTSSPAQKLEVQSGSIQIRGDGNALFGTYYASAGENTFFTIHSGSGNTFHIGNDVAGTYYNTMVFTAATDSTGGKVGIGTSSPGSKLQVNDSNPTLTLRANDGGTSRKAYIDFYTTFYNYPSDVGARRTSTIVTGFADGTYGTWGTEFLAFNVGSGSANDSALLPIERVRIDGSGNLGVGTSTVIGKLQVNSTAAPYYGPATSSANANGIFILGNTTTDVVNTFGVDATSTAYAWIQPRKSSAATYYSLVLNPNGGNVGVGTTSPVATLQVNGNISGSSFTSSISNAVGFLGTSSWASNVVSASYATTAQTANALNTSNNYQVNSIGVNIAGSGTAGKIGTNELGVRSWSITPTGGRLLFESGDGNGSAYFVFPVSASTFVGAGTGLTGTAASLTAGTANALNAANSYTVASLTSGYVDVTGTTIPTTGIYRPSTKTLGLSADSTLIFKISNVAAPATSSIETGNFLVQSGNVGIGTTNPTDKLTVYGALASYKDGANTIQTQVYLANAGNTRAFNIQLNSGGTGLDLWSYNSSNAWLRHTTFDYDGKVGIGTAAPAAKFEISGSSNSALMNIKSPISGAILYVSGSGAVGIGTSNVGAYTLQVNGSFGATTKSFIIDHPTKEGKKLIYGSLESPYHGIRLTGRDTLKEGKCKIQLPDYIYKLILHDSVNIQLTGIKCNKTLYVDDINIPENYFTIAYDKAIFETHKDYDFFWDFTAIRADVPELITEL